MVVILVNSCMLIKILFVEFSYQQASARNDQITELNCFLHYYSRFKNHENSYKVNCLFIVQCQKISTHLSQKGLVSVTCRSGASWKKNSSIVKEWISLHGSCVMRGGEDIRTDRGPQKISGREDLP